MSRFPSRLKHLALAVIVALGALLVLGELFQDSRGRAAASTAEVAECDSLHRSVGLSGDHAGVQHSFRASGVDAASAVDAATADVNDDGIVDVGDVQAVAGQ